MNHVIMADVLWRHVINDPFPCKMRKLDIMADVKENRRVVATYVRPGRREVLRTVLQVFHLAVAASLFLVGVAEFSLEPSIFDVFGKSSEQRAVIPATVFKVSLHYST